MASHTQNLPPSTFGLFQNHFLLENFRSGQEENDSGQAQNDFFLYPNRFGQEKNDFGQEYSRFGQEKYGQGVGIFRCGEQTLLAGVTTKSLLKRS
jgi:hypothetical protein